MSGTKAGGLKARAKNLENDPDFYKKIGAKGGKNGHTGGFAANPELARIAGAKGGRISRRTKTIVPVTVYQAPAARTIAVEVPAFTQTLEIQREADKTKLKQPEKKRSMLSWLHF